MFYTNNFFLVLFFFIVLLVRLLPFNYRKYFLILISFSIIGTWGLPSLLIFSIIAVAGFIFALVLGPEPTKPPFKNKNIVLACAIIFNLFLLMLFKYRAFIFGESFSEIFDSQFGRIGIPLGISFYTFHIISYLVDLHAGKYERSNWFDYLFYLSFFPHVIAGPIVRGWQLMPQTSIQRKTLMRDLVFGSHLFLTGFFLKTVCADNIGAVIDPYWSTSSGLKFSASEHWLVALYYYFQLYGDFAGYSLMACGMARLLGYRLPGNFKAPMRAVGLQDFWRRWHITLSRWLRDYLYIPLGGNRVGIKRNCINLLIVMGLGGLWHGAAWTFVVWGLIHGMGLVIEKFLSRPTNFLQISCWWFCSQIIITLAWVFFRSPSINFANDFIAKMFVNPVHQPVNTALLYLSVFTIPLIFHHFASPVVNYVGHTRIMPVIGILSGVVLALTILVQSPPTVFIYFAF